MYRIIVVTHGNLASALIETSRMIVGEQKELYGIELREGESVESLKEEIEPLLGGESLILTDLFGASPTNVSMKFMGQNTEVVTGVNLPMLLEILTNRGSLGDGAKTALSSGRDSIKRLRDLLSRC